MPLGGVRRYYRVQALSVASELIEQHAGTDAMIDLPEDEADIFSQECQNLAAKLNKMAETLKAGK